MKPIPSPKCLPVIGTMLSIVAAGGAPKFHLYVDKRHRQLGPIYRENLGPLSAVFLSDADHMRKIFALEGRYPRHVIPDAWLVYNQMYSCKRGLLFMDGEEWFKFRKTMNNLLLKVDDAKFYDSAEVAADDLISKLERGQLVTNLESQLYKWSLEVIMAVLLGPNNYKRCESTLLPLIDQLSATVHQIFVATVSLSLIPVKMAVKLNLPAWKRFVSAVDSTMDQGRKIVAELFRQINNSTDDDGDGLLSQMLSTDMTEEDVKRIVIDLVLAAGDTTTHTTQWLLHLLSIDAPNQTKIFQELRQSSERDDYKSPLLKGCLKEALRLYPVAPFITRFMPENVILDEYQIEANELVLMSLYSSGRNPNYFPEPDAFLPERWLRGSKGYKGVNNANASLPFAFGSRSCVGKKLAQTQILVMLSKVLRNFEVIAHGKNDKIDPVLHMITVPGRPVEIILKRRH